MPKPGAKKATRGYQFKITLNDSSPSIWRRIIILKDATFFELHLAIQGAMGWTDSHLHAFRFQDKNSRGRPVTIEFPNPEFDQDADSRDERKEKIASYFGNAFKQCQYDYDFGDGWEHTVLFEKEVALDPKEKYPKCIDGKNACPPDDCGGIGGYYGLIEILKDPGHSEHDDMLDWLDLKDPDEFRPEKFDPKDTWFWDPKKRLKEYEKGFDV